MIVLFLSGFVGFVVLILGRFFGEKGASFLTISSIFLTCILSLYYWKNNILFGNIFVINGPLWLKCGLVEIKWSFVLDSLSLTMFVVVSLISFFVHLYSVDYMKGDPHLTRFLAYLSIFTFFMLILVSANNLIQFFLGWEGVGLSSYLLINFWFTRKQANKSALKAMVINRLGDICLILFLGLIYLNFKSFDFAIIFLLTPFLKDSVFFFLGFTFNYLDILTFFLFLGAMGKSAQLGLHLWLPDAMEGPTPVSALIHAATMVTAGVYLVVRFSILFEYSLNILKFVAFIGGITLVFAATTGLFQNDLKKIIAYSTCSQLGYMFLSCGMSSYSGAMFHLFTHAFFKALLFLGAGGVIHSICDEQDLRKMGGLATLLPLTYVSMLIGSVSLMGFPFLSGFYSKEWILELCLSKSEYFFYSLALIGTFLTSFYSLRLLYVVFLSLPKGSFSIYKNVHEVSFFMRLSYFFLIPLSIFSGYLFKELFLGFGGSFWDNSIFIKYDNNIVFETEFLPFTLKLFPLFFGLLGSILSYLSYSYYSSVLAFLFKEKIYLFFVFLSKKWYFDEIGNNIVFFFLQEGYKQTFKSLDRGFFEFIGSTGIVRLVDFVSKQVTKFQTGYIYHYMFFMFLGLVLFIFFLLLSTLDSFLVVLFSIFFIYTFIKQ